jgi:hypothetical protein
MSDLKLCLSSAQAALAMAPHWTPEYALERYTRRESDGVESWRVVRPATGSGTVWSHDSRWAIEIASSLVDVGLLYRGLKLE